MEDRFSDGWSNNGDRSEARSHENPRGKNRGLHDLEPVGGIKFPRGGWLKNPFEELTFIERKDIQNPMRFVQRLKKIADYEDIEMRDRLHYFGRTMR